MVEFIWDSYATLNKCRESIEKQLSGAYLRFGDGDVYLREGRDDMLQKNNPKIAEEMKEAFSLSGEGIIKCLPLHSDEFGSMPEMRPGIHKRSNGFANSILNSSRTYFENQKIYSPVALHYLGVHDKAFVVDFLRFIRRLNPIFVGNQNVPNEVVNKLFNKTVHIKTPTKQSFGQIDQIEKETLNALDQNVNNYQVIVTAMGCSGRVLATRILKKQHYKVFIFDFGSLLDALCGWNSRAWIGLSKVPPAYWEEMLDEISSD